MAQIPTSISERILNISAWRGVNEAAEGEASLKLGEAAVMRNFCVTSGGALKKRPGSRNVAGLLNNYVIKTEEETTPLFLEAGRQKRQLWPRAEVSDMGVIDTAGEPEDVGPVNVPEHKGWFLKKDNEVWRLDGCREIRGDGETAIDGGMGSRGELTVIETGSVDLIEDGTLFYYGPETIRVWPGARIEGGELSVTGTPAEYPNARFDGTGFETNNVGGFILRDGRLWEYYGAKMEKATIWKAWKKYEVNWVETSAGSEIIPGHWHLGEEVGTEFFSSTDEIFGFQREIMIGELKYYLAYEWNNTLGSRYYAYRRDFSNPIEYGVYYYAWYGYPLTVTENSYEWNFQKTYADISENTDRQVRGIWSGFVGGREVICACCGGSLWELRQSEDGIWEKIAAGELDTSGDIHMFGFDERLYLLGRGYYKVWDGERLEDVEGYRPLVSVSVEPKGGGTLLESVNRLTGGRRCWFSPDGETQVFLLPEKNLESVDWVMDLSDGSSPGQWRADLEAGEVIFYIPPAKGINSIEVAWTVKENSRSQVLGMRYAELYNGAQDTRVFLYGDGSNRALYSGLDYNGKPRADYFPDLYEVAVGDSNTPLTAMIRHYNKLMAYKLDSAWTIGYDTITLPDGTVTAGFYVSPVNRSIGCCAYGQAQLVQNRPRTLDGRSVIEWRATSSSGITGDQRNAERVSQRVDASIRKFDLAKAKTFYDKISHEYFVIGEDGTAIAQNMDVDAWYVYTGLMATCMINYRDELYYGTRDGYLRHFSWDYFSDNGEPIDAYWESGAISFSEDFRQKNSAMVWIGIKPENNGYLEVTAQTDRKSDLAVYDVQTLDAGAVPEMQRIKLKAKKFTYYKLILQNRTADRTATVVSANLRVRSTGTVK